MKLSRYFENKGAEYAVSHNSMNLLRCFLMRIKQKSMCKDKRMLAFNDLHDYLCGFCSHQWTTQDN